MNHFLIVLISKYMYCTVEANITNFSLNFFNLNLTRFYHVSSSKNLWSSTLNLTSFSDFFRWACISIRQLFYRVVLKTGLQLVISLVNCIILQPGLASFQTLVNPIFIGRKTVDLFYLLFKNIDSKYYEVLYFTIKFQARK